MFGLMVLAALAAYFAISVGVVLFVVLQAKKRNRNPVLWGIIAGLIMYNLVFWDYLPTLIVFNHKVKTESGFWVYKTPDQWKIENPGVAENLTWLENSPHYEAPGILLGRKLNERIGWWHVKHRTQILDITTTDELVVDLKNNEVLLKRSQVSSGYSSSSELRFWVKRNQSLPKDKFNELKQSYKKLGEEKP